jgi:hypothetical protein
MSLSSELIICCVHMFAKTFEAEQRVSLHQGKDAPCSGATKGTIPSIVPSSFFTKIFKKNPDICVETDCTSERFFYENYKDDDLHGMMGCYSFKAPSAYTPAVIARRLGSTPLAPVSI